MGFCPALGTWLQSSTVPGHQVLLSKNGMKGECSVAAGVMCTS